MITPSGQQSVSRVSDLFAQARLSDEERTRADAFLRGLVATHQGGILKEESLNDIIAALTDTEPATLEERIRELIHVDEPIQP